MSSDPGQWSWGAEGFPGDGRSLRRWDGVGCTHQEGFGDVGTEAGAQVCSLQTSGGMLFAQLYPKATYSLYN